MYLNVVCILIQVNVEVNKLFWEMNYENNNNVSHIMLNNNN